MSPLIPQVLDRLRRLRRGFAGRRRRHLRPAVVPVEQRLAPAVVGFAVVNDWGSGFQGEISIRNDEPQAISNWRLEFDFPGQITQVWDATLAQHAGNHYELTGASWNVTIAPGATVKFGFLATPGHPSEPSNYLINGRSPSGGGGNPGDPLPSLSVSDAAVVEGNPSPGATAGSLRTQGNQIVDAAGNPVRISGVNWFGFETSNFAPHGLWTRSYQSMMDQMKQEGFNTIRLPFSNQLFDPGSTPNGIDFHQNPDLVGLNGLQILDKIVSYAGQVGLRIILDNHRSEAGNGPNDNGLWYTSAYPESRWISDWQSLAGRYRGNPTIIGADLKNEPHAGSWGDGNPATDWRLAAERAGNAILGINPDWLIIVEGVSSGPSGNYWWGGNLSAAGANPVRLDVPGRLVYSPHDYPSTVYPQPWFSAPDYPNNLPSVWDANWGYLYRQGIAPILIGEFGSRLQTTSDQQWLAKLVDYLEGDLDGNGTRDIPAGNQGPSWTYWSWNPNSMDTGGILGDDWRTVQQGKVDAVRPVQFGSLGGGTAPAVTLLQFTVRLSSASSQGVTVNYATASGTATAGGDYTAAAGSLTFAPGETTKTISVAVNPDTLAEPDETILLRISGATNATIADNEGVGTVANDDEAVPPPLPALSIDDASAAEGNAGTTSLTFTVRLSAASNAPVSVNYEAASGTAALGSDFAATSGILTFSPGQTARTITVVVQGDTQVEPNETFALNLGGADGATIADGAAIGTIVNDDAPPTNPQPAVGLRVNSQWSTGFVADITIRNLSNTPMTDWVLEFDAPFAIPDIWNADIVSRTGTRYRLRAKSYNAQIPAGGSVTFGLRGAGPLDSGMTNVTLNGVPVTIG